MAKKITFLIAHTNAAGNNVGQAKIQHVSEARARQTFRELFPDRKILTIGVEGEE